MSNRRTIILQGLVSLAFAAGLFGMTQMVTTSAHAIAGAYSAPTYGSAIIGVSDEAF